MAQIFPIIASRKGSLGVLLVQGPPLLLQGWAGSLKRVGGINEIVMCGIEFLGKIKFLGALCLATCVHEKLGVLEVGFVRVGAQFDGSLILSFSASPIVFELH